MFGLTLSIPFAAYSNQDQDGLFICVDDQGRRILTQDKDEKSKSNLRCTLSKAAPSSQAFMQQRMNLLLSAQQMQQRLQLQMETEKKLWQISEQKLLQLRQQLQQKSAQWNAGELTKSDQEWQDALANATLHRHNVEWLQLQMMADPQD